MKEDYKKFPVTISGTKVIIKDSRDFEKALRAFNKKVQDAGIIKRVKEKMYYEPKSEKRRRQKAIGRKRYLKKLEKSKLK